MGGALFATIKMRGCYMLRRGIMRLKQEDGCKGRVFRQEGSNVRYFYYDGDKIIAEREGSVWVVRYLQG